MTWNRASLDADNALPSTKVPLPTSLPSLRCLCGGSQEIGAQKTPPSCLFFSTIGLGWGEEGGGGGECELLAGVQNSLLPLLLKSQVRHSSLHSSLRNRGTGPQRSNGKRGSGKRDWRNRYLYKAEKGDAIFFILRASKFLSTRQ